MKKVFYLCCLMFLSIKGIAQYTEDPNFDAVINDNFDVSPRYWDNSYSDSEYIWKAYFAATGITHGNSEHQVYQRSHAVFDTINDMMLLVADYVSDTDLGCDDVEVPTGIYCNISNNYSIRYFSGAIESIQKVFYTDILRYDANFRFTEVHSQHFGFGEEITQQIHIMKKLIF